MGWLTIVMSLELESCRGVRRGFQAGECLLCKGQRGVRGMFGRMRSFIARDLRKSPSKKEGRDSQAGFDALFPWLSSVHSLAILVPVGRSLGQRQILDLYPLVLHYPVPGLSTPLANGILWKVIGWWADGDAVGGLYIGERWSHRVFASDSLASSPKSHARKHP